MRLFSRVEYDGSDFAGWQVQPDANSVQAELEKALFTVTRETCSIVGAGRTDAGVHGRGQGFHFDMTKPFELYKLTKGINSVLPSSIAVYDMQEVDQEFHARFSAKKRTYTYTITTRKSPLMYNRAAYIGYAIDWVQFENSLKEILGEHSFTSLCAANGYTENHTCIVTQADLKHISETVKTITVSADRFIYKMIRTLIGTLVDMSRGRILLTMSQLIENEDRSLAGVTAPPQGLVLENVAYDSVG